MRYRVAIRRNSDGRIHVTRWDDYNGSLPGLEFWWMEGNMACDCNRHGEFERVADPDCGNLAMEHGCGDGDYDVVRFEIDGKRYTPEQLTRELSYV